MKITVINKKINIAKGENQITYDRKFLQNRTL